MSAFGRKADIGKKCECSGQYPETEFNRTVGRLRRERKLPQRDHQSVEVGGNDQPRLAARQRQNCAVLVGEYDRARSGADRDTPAGSSVDAINI